MGEAHWLSSIMGTVKNDCEPSTAGRLAHGPPGFDDHGRDRTIGFRRAEQAQRDCFADLGLRLRWVKHQN